MAPLKVGDAVLIGQPGAGSSFGAVISVHEGYARVRMQNGGMLVADSEVLQFLRERLTAYEVTC